MLRTLRKAEYFEINTLFFLQAAAMGCWYVPLGMILDANGYHALKPYAFATTALAAFVSPLIFGAMADRHASPVRVLRGLAVGTALAMTLACLAIQFHRPVWLVLVLIQAHALCMAPMWSISSTIVFARLADAKMEFGPVRALGTLGWMAGCWLVSALAADTSTLAGYCGVGLWLMLAGFTHFLPELETPKSVADLTWHERLGLDALTLLKIPEHRVVFITAALFAVPLAAFYPYATANLQQIGLTRTSAWMTLGQVSELIAMFSLGALLLRWRIKWIFALGLGFGVLRFAFSALGGKFWLPAGVFLHGFSFVFFYITAQIYLEQRVETAWRARAQALMSLMNTGVGSLIGYLGCGWWFAACTPAARTNWMIFWGGLSAAVAVAAIYFLISHPGRLPIRHWLRQK